MISHDEALRFVRLAFFATAAFALLAGLLIAVTVPIHAWDALAYGEWSRLIGEHWSLRFPDISAQTYHRPLFYVLQGVLWGAFGFHEWIGRVLSLAFTVLLFGATACLSARGRWASTSAALAVVLLCLMSDVLEGMASGLTDIPVAALVALTAAVAYADRGGRLRPTFIAVSAGCAVLVKPTAVIALVALLLSLVLWPRADRRRELARGILPLALGTAVALTYDLVQARDIGVGFLDFLRAGSTGFYEQLARESRFDQLVGLQWLGVELRPLLVYGLVYAGARVAGANHRRGALAGLAATPVLALALPALADDDAGIESSLGSLGSGVAFAALCVSLVGALWCAPEDEPRPESLGRMLLFGGVPAVVWLWYGAYDTRLGSAAWPGLVALIALGFMPALVGIARRFPPALVVPGATLVATAAFAYTHLDDLGPERWRTYQSLGVNGMFDEARTRNIVQPQLSEVVALARMELGPDDRLASSDGKLRFYFPGRVAQDYPSECSDLRGFRAFVLLTDDESRAYMRDVIRVPYEASYWASCDAPKLTMLSTLPGYVYFRVGP